MMNKIIKTLENKNVIYKLLKQWGVESIIIPIEKNCVWVNTYGEKMEYDKTIKIYEDSYKNFIMVETTGYNLSKMIAKNTKQDEIIKIINVRF